ncbi:hypothetical protein [Arthrobacter sp. HY1533]|uniref:hypothetical protein n=1 Tax=Arthrobacter sp. HY1533 TaxID=2970919 RepID=UPI0022B9F9F7|nr:hypothetical protein [Arthrobacter sp. HY1533]
MNQTRYFATRLSDIPGPKVRAAKTETPEQDKEWFDAYVADRRLRGVDPNGVVMDGEEPAPRGRPSGPQFYCKHGHRREPGNVLTYETPAGMVRLACLTCHELGLATVPATKPRTYKPVTSAPKPPRTHCTHGHELTRDNVYIIKATGRRQCRTCQLAATRKNRKKSAKPRQPKTHCVHGHEYTEANTFINRKGARECRTCIQARINARKVSA